MFLIKRYFKPEKLLFKVLNHALTTRYKILKPIRDLRLKLG